MARLGISCINRLIIHDMDVWTHGSRATYKRMAPFDVLDRVRRIEGICGRHAVPLAAAALQFPPGLPVGELDAPRRGLASRDPAQH